MTKVGIIMNGVTGRMGTNQHLRRSIAAIRKEGGVLLKDGSRIWPDPVLVGRNPEKLKALAEECGIERWSTNLDEVLADSYNTIYFDAQTTDRRAEAVKKAIAAGKHVYCEKPLAEKVSDTIELAKLAKQTGIKAGIVQDKLFLPGLRKLDYAIKSGYLGQILSIRGEFGYWVFEGHQEALQRPSWNYRAEDGGGITLDMFAHWQYVFENLFGRVKSLSCRRVIHIPERIDEQGKPYQCTADDAVYGTFELEGGIIAQMNSSWATRVYRDDLLILQVDGTQGSAVAGLRDCKIQHRASTPRAIWNPDLPVAFDYRDGWQTVPDKAVYDNAFKIQWEMFLRHVAEDAPFPHDFLEAARGVQLAELGLKSSELKTWVDVPDITLD